MQSICVRLACAFALVALVAAASTSEAAPAKPDCGKTSEYFDKGPDSQKYIHCRKGEVLYKECAKGQVWNQSKNSCDSRSAQSADDAGQDQADSADLSIVPADWRSIHGWCWGWPIVHVQPVVVYRYRWVYGTQCSGWYGRCYAAFPLSQSQEDDKSRGSESGDNSGDASSESGDSGDHHESGEPEQGEQQGEQHHQGDHPGSS